MYLNFYHFRKEPFNITPDPELLYLSPSHKEALAAAIYGVTERKGFVAIVGEVGVGKTTILRSFLDKMNGSELKIIHLQNAGITFPELLKHIYGCLDLVPSSCEVFTLVNELQRELVRYHEQGITVVLLLDEAQNLPIDTLKSLHMLSNLETSTTKLIQVVLSGQPELEEKLQDDSLRQIRQRVVIKVKILPLSEKESYAYIKHRLAKTRKGGTDLFTAGALRLIVKESRGIPRVINTLCDNCLITSYGRQLPKVPASVAREVIADAATPPSRLRAAWVAAALFVLVAGSLGLWLTRGTTPPPRSVVATSVSPPVAAPAPVSPVSVTPSGAKPLPPTELGTPAESPAEATTRLPAPEGRTPLKRAAEEKAEVPPRGLPVADAVVEGEQAEMGRTVVKRGDTLARLISRRYGFVNRRLMAMVKRSNPQIANVDLIHEGEVLYLPPLK